MSKFKAFLVLSLLLWGCGEPPPVKVIQSDWVEKYNVSRPPVPRGRWEVTAYYAESPFFSIGGELKMSSSKNFHLILEGWLSREVEVWSNDKEFSFWSKKYDKIFTYQHNEPNNLKGPFQPIFLEAILSPPEIKEPFTENEKYWIARDAGNGFHRLLYVNKSNMHLDWVILTDSDNKVVVAGKREGGSPPSKVVIDWKQEKTTSVWEISYTSS